MKKKDQSKRAREKTDKNHYDEWMSNISEKKNSKTQRADEESD